MRLSFIQLFNLNDKRRVLEFKYILINSLSMHETLIKKAVGKEKNMRQKNSLHHIPVPPFGVFAFRFCVIFYCFF